MYVDNAPVAVLGLMGLVSLLNWGFFLISKSINNKNRGINNKNRGNNNKGNNNKRTKGNNTRQYRCITNKNRRNQHSFKFQRQQKHNQLLFVTSISWRSQNSLNSKQKQPKNLITITSITNSSSITSIACIQVVKEVPVIYKANASTSESKVSTEKKNQRRVWFPTDADMEPHKNNPDNDFGGALYCLEERIPIYYFDSAGEILEGRAARVAARNERECQNRMETSNLCNREFNVPAIQGGSGGDWLVLEAKLDLLVEPDWSMIGSLWRMLHGDAPRIGEE